MVNFLAVTTAEFIAIRAFVSAKRVDYFQQPPSDFVPRFPIQSFQLMMPRAFVVEV